MLSNYFFRTQKVYAPFQGTLYVKSDRQVRIKVKNLYSVDVFIDNVDAHKNMSKMMGGVDVSENQL